MATIQIGLSARPARTSAGLAVLFVLSWSSGFIGAKMGAADAPVTTVLMWRFLPLALVLLPFLRDRRRGPGRAGEPEPAPGTQSDWLRQVAVGALSQSGYLLTVYWAIALGVSTGTTALIDGIQPLVVAALVGPLLGAAVNGRQWVGLGLGLAGVALVTWADATAPSTDAPVWGYAVPFAGMLSLVAATFLDRRGRTTTPPMRAMAIHCTTSAVVLTVLALATGTAVPPSAGGFWVAMAWLVGFSTFGGYGLYWLLLGRIGVTRVNTLMFLVPPVTTVWGAVMFGEPFGRATAAGLGLALAATWIVTAYDGASRARRPAEGDAVADAVAGAVDRRCLDRRCLDRRYHT